MTSIKITKDPEAIRELFYSTLRKARSSFKRAEALAYLVDLLCGDSACVPVACCEEDEECACTPREQRAANHCCEIYRIGVAMERQIYRGRRATVLKRLNKRVD